MAQAPILTNLHNANVHLQSAFIRYQSAVKTICETFAIRPALQSTVSEAISIIEQQHAVLVQALLHSRSGVAAQINFMQEAAKASASFEPQQSPEQEMASIRELLSDPSNLTDFGVKELQDRLNQLELLFPQPQED